ncbi:MAG: hypothetical protein SGBAC_005763 [Bacillariaceae sp.]
MSEEAEKDTNRGRKPQSSKHRGSSREAHDDVLGGSERKSSKSKPERRKSKDDHHDGKRSSDHPSRRKSRDASDGDELGESSGRKPERRKSKDDSDGLGGSGKRSSDRPSRRKSRDSHDGEVGASSGRKPERRKSKDSSDDLGGSDRRSSGRPSRRKSSDSHDNHEARAFTEDQRAKAKSRRNTSGATVPGAFVDSAQGKNDRESLGGDRESRDKEAKNRARRSTGEAKPASVRESRDRRAKDQARRQTGSGDVRPGASSEVRGTRQAKSPLPANARETTASGASMHIATDSSNEDHKTPSIEDEVEVKAIAVDDVENEQVKKQQLEIENLKKTLTHVTQTRNEAPEEPPPPPEEKNTNARKKCIYVIIALVLIGGGIAGYLLGTRGTDVVEKSDPNDIAPAELTTEPPTSVSRQTDPTSAPTVPPSKFQRYEEPSPEDCAAIASGNEVDDQALIATNSFTMELDVTLESDRYDANTYLPALKDGLQAIWMPEVAGCTTLTTRRHLRERRRLQLTDFAIANGLVLDTVTPPGSSCRDGTGTSCVSVVVTLDLWLREEVRSFELLGHLATVLGDDPVGLMSLQGFFVSIIVVTGYATVPVDQESAVPTDLPILNLTPVPTVGISSSPTLAPVVGPTTEEPTFAPVVGSTTGAPTKKPTLSPTGAPTISPTTLSPTRAPVVGLTPPPTSSPTSRPTQPPTPGPTIPPTPGPTESPSSMPSSQPSKLPTNLPSVSPSWNPTSTPTAMPALITPSATATMSSEYFCNPSICDAGGELSIPNGYSDRAVDGNTDGVYANDSSIHTWLQYNPWWRVNFSGAKDVVKVIVWNRVDDGIDDIIGCEVELLDASDRVLASRPITSNAASTEHDFTLVSGVRAVRVIQKKEDAWYYLYLAEVQVFGFADADLLATDTGKVSSRSSTLYCALTCSNAGWYLVPSGANRAIDGETGQTWGDGLCHTSQQFYPWWKVDLGFTATVHRIKIWNRNDFQSNMIATFIELLDASGTILHSHEITETENIYEFEYAGGIAGVTTVRAAKYVENVEFIYFAEFEAFGYQTS